MFRILLSPAYINAVNFLKGFSVNLNRQNNTAKNSSTEQSSDTPNMYKPYLRLLGFKKNSSEFLRTLRYSEQLDVITKPADGPLSNPSYMLDIFASNLYEQVCSTKYNSDFTEEIKVGPIII